MPITIDDTGQTVTLNPPYSPVTPDDSLQKITRVYFAKKTVTREGANVAFTRIDSLHAQQEGGQNLPYDSVLGKTVYLVIETENMATLSIDAVIRPGDNTLTGNTETLNLMWFNPATQNFEVRRKMTAVVGNFDALNNKGTTENPSGSHDHYTNLADHENKAIIKLQLRPSLRTDFNTWAANIAAAATHTANLEVVVERTDNEACAYGPDSTEEVKEAGIFLNSDAQGRFRVGNRNFYEIYARVLSGRTNNRNTYTDGTYNFLPMNGTVRRKISKLENPSSTQVTYYHYDIYGNEVFIATCDKTSVMGRNNGQQLGAVPPGALRTENAPAGGAAQTNHIFANAIVTTGTHRNDRNARAFPGALRIVRYTASGTNVPLVRMPDTLNVTVNGRVIAYGFSNTQRRFCNPDCFAAFVGVLSQYGLAGVNSTGMCFGDATSYPSLAHPNGDSVDTSYLANRQNEQDLLNAFVDWNFAQVIAGTTQQAWLRNAHRYAGDHNDHLHSGDFDSNSIHNIYQ
ncbi:hypothetical protein [Flavobacterium lindanitolerans]|uniref:hypothetical protein n=1 Tax=Flavobacterium lindanitolerans TaxID=428988 RepID=UPI0031CFED52